jgi:hypothetical protein
VFHKTSCFLARRSNITIKDFLPGKLTELAGRSLVATLLAADLPEQHGERVIKLVHHALLERDDGIVRDANVLGTNLRTTLGYIAQT